MMRVGQVMDEKDSSTSSSAAMTPMRDLAIASGWRTGVSGKGLENVYNHPDGASNAYKRSVSSSATPVICKNVGSEYLNSNELGFVTKATGETTSSSSSTQTWLPVPAVNPDISWNELADSDDEDLSRVYPPRISSTQMLRDDAHEAACKGSSGPLIPSYDGQTAPFTVAVRSPDTDADSYGCQESPTPVTVVKELSSSSDSPSHTQFGFSIDSSSKKREIGEGVAEGPVKNANLEVQVPKSRLDGHIQPRLEAVSPIRTMVSRAKDGLCTGRTPDAARDGMGGTYFLSDAAGEKVAIFKPCDEEPMAPNNPKGWAGRSMTDPGMKPSVRVGEAALREVAAFLLDHDGFAGVPPACLVAVSHENFNYSASKPDYPDSSNPCDSQTAVTRFDPRLVSPALRGGLKLGSLQQFVAHTGDANDTAPCRFSADSVHRIGLLDIRLLNLDRHAGNLLVAEPPRCSNSKSPGALHKLIPIDHGYAMPEALDDPYFEWMYWPQASVPFSAEVKAYVEALDGEADVELLKRELPAIRPECLRCLLLTTQILKDSVAAGMTLHEIAQIFTRSSIDEPSDFEAMCMDARSEALAAPSQPSFPPLNVSRASWECANSGLLNSEHFDECSGNLSPLSSLGMSGLIGGFSMQLKTSSGDSAGEAAASVEGGFPNSPCMDSIDASGLFCAVSRSGQPATPGTPSWLQTIAMPPTPDSVAAGSPYFFNSEFPFKQSAPNFLASSCAEGCALQFSGLHVSAHPARTQPRSVWHSKHVPRRPGVPPALPVAVHPDKANYVFSDLSEHQWQVFLSHVQAFVHEELAAGTWKASVTACVAASCPN